MDPTVEDTQRFTRMWMDFASKMAGSGLSWKPDSAPPEVARQVRHAMFQALGQYADDFLRSPEFLQMMKQSMDSAIALRKQFNDFLTQAHHVIQGVAQEDVDGVLNSIRRMESRVLEKMEDLTQRMDGLDKRLAALEPARARRGKEEPSKPST